MKNEFMLAINQLCNERNLSRDVVIEAIETALVSAYKKTPRGNAVHVSAKIDPVNGKAMVYAHKQVVEEVKDERLQVSLEWARRINSQAQLEDTIDVEITPRNFGRIAAQTAKQVIMQRIREAEREALFDNYVERQGEIISGTIQTVKAQGVTLSLGKAEALLPRAEQIPGERYHFNQRTRVYVLEVNRTTRGPQITASRTHKDFLRRLLELEVPEIFSGTVEIKAIAREPGSRSKVAVVARQEGVDPVGSCVGMRGVRIQNIVNELNGEKIDVVEWSSDPATFVAKALSPATVVRVDLIEDRNGPTASVVVPDKQLSLAIGKRGQNARLAAKLTGWRIDIKKESEALEDDARRAAEEAARAKEEAALEAARALLAEAEAAAEEKEPVVPGAETPEEVTIEPPEAAEPAVEPPQVAEAGAGVVKTKEEVVAEVTEDVMPEPEPAEEAAPADEVSGKAEREEPQPAAEPWDSKALLSESWFEWTGDEDELEEEDEGGREKKKTKKRRRQLVFDEVIGETIVRRGRKAGRRRDVWDDDYHD